MIRPARHLRFGTSSSACVVAASIAALSVGGAASAQDREVATLHEAAGRGERATVLRLLDRGADINARDDQGGTPLHGLARTIEVPTDAAAAPPSGAPRLRLGPLLTVDINLEISILTS